ncbi:MAG: sirohydrochlorin chelatase [Cyanothece sp. SIO2G6]|nr:sirohydrochlorin chelatase [Cyanothece sp. SIO2G6]
MSQFNPLLLLGHGTRDADGRHAFLEFADKFQSYDPSRPVVPCFLELTEPSVQEGIDRCIERGYTDLTVLPVLLFAARHSKFDVTNELDRACERHPTLTLHYGRHFGVSLRWLELWQQRLQKADQASMVPREQTVLLFVGRGASDPDANGDVYKLARMLWEGSGYLDLEVCFTGITHPRMERGFERARAWNPDRIIVIPHLLFDGVLAKRIHAIVAAEQAAHPQIEVQTLPVIGTDPILFELIRDRELEAQNGAVVMNCYTCKFRQALSAQGHGHHHHPDHHANHTHSHAHDHHANHTHSHAHDHHPHSHSPTPPLPHSPTPPSPNLYHGIPDLYPDADEYHQRAWQVP